MSLSDDEDDDDEDDDMPLFGKRPAPIPVAPDSPPLSVAPSITRRGPVTNAARLFTADELAVLPEGLLDRQRQKQLAKKAKKKRAAAGLTEAELMAGFVGMDVEEQDPEMDAEMGEVQRPSKKQVRKEKKKAQKVEKPAPRIEVDPEAKREADFASFLQQVGDDDMDEEL